MAGADAKAEETMAAYLAHTDVMVAFAEALALDTFGRDIPQVLLAHVNRLNADAMPELLRRLRARGYIFVTLDSVLDDEAYDTPDRFVGRYGPSWLHRWRWRWASPRAWPPSRTRRRGSPSPASRSIGARHDSSQARPHAFSCPLAPVARTPSRLEARGLAGLLQGAHGQAERHLRRSRRRGVVLRMDRRPGSAARPTSRGPRGSRHVGPTAPGRR